MELLCQTIISETKNELWWLRFQPTQTISYKNAQMKTATKLSLNRSISMVTKQAPSTDKDHELGSKDTEKASKQTLKNCFLSNCFFQGDNDLFVLIQNQTTETFESGNTVNKLHFCFYQSFISKKYVNSVPTCSDQQQRCFLLILMMMQSPRNHLKRQRRHEL